MLKKVVSNLSLFLISFLLFAKCSFAIDIIDDQGIHVHLDKPATRIISLAPDITEILFAIGAGTHIIGVVNASDFPPDAKKITSVGSYTGIDLERIIALKPDLIITWSYTFARQLAALKTFNIPIYTTEPHHLEDIAKTMRHLGQLTQTNDIANQTADIYLTKLQSLKNVHQHLKPVRVFFQIGSSALFSINKDSWINQAIEFCGGQNIFAETRLTGAEVNMEAVLNAAPQTIISDARRDHWKQRWQRFPEIPAVKNHLLFAIDPDWIDRAGPRLLIGVAAMCDLINTARQQTSLDAPSGRRLD